MNKKKRAFSNSALKLPTASFYKHERTQKILPRQIQNTICIKTVLLREVFCSTILSQEISCQRHKVLQRKNIGNFF